jgi:hypothetical protein
MKKEHLYFREKLIDRVSSLTHFPKKIIVDEMKLEGDLQMTEEDILLLFDFLAVTIFRDADFESIGLKNLTIKNSVELIENCPEPEPVLESV